MEKLLIVDDSEEILQQLKWGLGKDYKVLLAEDVPQALGAFDRHRPAVMTLDLGLPPDADNATEGLQCLQEVLAREPATKVIVLTGNEDRANALRAIECGAYDYYSKPIRLEELKTILQRAFHLSRLEQELRALQQAPKLQKRHFVGLVGECPAMQSVFRTIEKVASYDAPVLILGDNGTGKELVARAIHEKGLRAKGPFVPINCGAIPENLLESELFGYEKGAFTGAASRVQGKVEYAQGGTLFLDEIGELPTPLQVKLLRFLQEKSIQRVGGRQDIELDVRIVAATNIDIQQAIREGRFREDLYYRIGLITMNLPPLRERQDDVLLLANYFMSAYAQEVGKNVRGFSRPALDALREYSWPGNVRELENRVKRAVIMTDAKLIEPEDLGFAPPAPAAGAVENPYGGMMLKEARARLEFDLVTRMIEEEQGNIVRAAERLGVSRPTLYDLMKKHGLSA